MGRLFFSFDVIKVRKKVKISNRYNQVPHLTKDTNGKMTTSRLRPFHILMQWHRKICILNVFLLSEREISPNYAGIFLDFVHGFGSYVKGLPNTKRCNSVAVTVSVRIRCICETTLRHHKREPRGQPFPSR